MKIYGLQKMTLLDFPGRVACTVFLNGCDFRCPFCHNYDLACGTAEPVMEEAELLTFLDKRRGLLDGVAVTGGEPCLHRDLPDLLGKIRKIGLAVKLDTNGAHPGMLRTLMEEGLLDYFAMDIKNSPEKYAETCGVPEADLAAVRESIRILMEGTVEYEFRTTLVKELHSSEDVDKMGRMIAGAKRYFLQCFTDRETVPYAGMSAPDPEKLREYAEIAGRYVSCVSLRGVD